MKDISRYLRKTIKCSVSGQRQKYRENLNEAWKKEWQASTRHKRFPAKDTPTPSSKKYFELISDHRLSRRMASLIFQLRTGHVPPTNTFTGS